MKINLGCGHKLLFGYVNVDCRPLPPVDTVVDLNVYPWQFADGSAEEIYASHLLEHLSDPVAAIREIYRILQPGGKVEIYSPNYTGYLGVSQGHNSYLSIQWFLDILGNADIQADMALNFTNVKLKMNVFHRQSKYRNVLITLWEWFWNKTPRRQLIWEVLGILHPGEIYWTAIKG